MGQTATPLIFIKLLYKIYHKQKQKTHFREKKQYTVPACSCKAFSKQIVFVFIQETETETVFNEECGSLKKECVEDPVTNGLSLMIQILCIRQL